MTMARRAIAGLAGVAMALAAGAAFAQHETPTALITAIYEPLLAGEWHEDEMAFFSAETRAEWQALLDEDPSGLGFSPLVDGQDAELADFAILAESGSAQRAQVAVSFTNFGAPRMLVFALVPEDGGWRVDDISGTNEDGEWQLSELLNP